MGQHNKLTGHRLEGVKKGH